ncbi:MAG: hypothetical protein GC184_02505 [Rhizobiales bacterium]|nr:hypothetical protein [Hyphomicrobiales bacterium]
MADMTYFDTTRRDQRPMPDNAISLRMAGNVLVATSLVVIALGLFREWFVYHFGEETVFQDMRHIALDAEQCLAAWYSSLTMVVCAGLLACITRMTYRRQQPDVGYWLVLTIVFIGLSLDESTSVHELALEPIQGALHTSGPFLFAWVIPALILVPAFGIFYLGFLRRLPAPYGMWFFLSGAVFVAGALGMEMVGGVTYEAYGATGLKYIMSFALEESLEIIAMTSFLVSLLSYVKYMYGRLELEL